MLRCIIRGQSGPKLSMDVDQNHCTTAIMPDCCDNRCEVWWVWCSYSGYYEYSGWQCRADVASRVVGRSHVIASPRTNSRTTQYRLKTSARSLNVIIIRKYSVEHKNVYFALLKMQADANVSFVNSTDWQHCIHQSCLLKTVHTLFRIKCSEQETEETEEKHTKCRWLFIL